jgi:DNA (cytosine-5)-methyltransferase 1
VIALDLFAGTGWGVACQRLGLTEHGGEIMPEAVASRWLNGMLTPYGDVSAITIEQVAAYPLHIASPPCQTFSIAGKGAGREALERVLQGVQALACGWPWHPTDGDPRTWLVLEPLRLALGARPMHIVWEQVPGVLPVWEACADVLRTHGYSVWTGNLQAEQYGVPQTRKRALFIARRDGKAAAPPVPTHSRYYPRDPSRLDQGVKPWVSMAEALGWGVTGRPSFTVTGGGSATGGAEPFGNAARQSLLAYRNDNQAHTAERPAPTVHFGARSNTVDWVYRSSVQPNRTERPIDVPAPTVLFGNDAASVHWVQRSNYSSRGGSDQSTPSPIEGSPPLGKRELHQPSATVTAKVGHWVQRPATTVLGDPRIAAPGHHDRQMNNSTRVTVQEAAILQTYPAGFRFAGKSGAQYQQVGNAVPPLLAEAVLMSLLDLT